MPWLKTIATYAQLKLPNKVQSGHTLLSTLIPLFELVVSSFHIEILIKYDVTLAYLFIALLINTYVQYCHLLIYLKPKEFSY